MLHYSGRGRWCVGQLVSTAIIGMVHLLPFGTGETIAWCVQRAQHERATMSTMIWKSSKLLSVLGSMLIILSACGASGPITATLSDTAIHLSRSTANAGKVTFTITNATTSGQKHEFVVVQTDLAAEQLPKNAEGLVDEEKLTSFGEQGDIEPGKTVDLTVDLHPGRYMMICNLPGHYNAGMHTEFNVSP